jgi:hypothetical protein
VPGRLATVSIFRNGERYDTNVTAGSVFEAARNAIRFFRSSTWFGPRQEPGDILEGVTGDDRRWRVRVSRVDRLKGLP